MLNVLQETQSNLSTMTKWVPVVDFDEQQLQMQPDCDTTFGYYGRNINSILIVDECNDDFLPPRNEVMFREQEICLVQKIKTTMYGDSLIGRRLTNEEVEDADTREYETISMIRRAGMGPSVDVALRSDRTIPAITSGKSHTTRDFPLLYDDKYFKLKPRKSSDSDTQSTPNSSLSDSKKEATKVQKDTCHRSEKSPRNASKVLNRSKKDETTPETIKTSGRVESPHNKPRRSTKSPSSPLPMPGDNANTPVLEISKTSTPKRPKSRIAANFAALDTKSASSSPILSSDYIRALRNSLVFLTPAELYKKKRQQIKEVKAN